MNKKLFSALALIAAGAITSAPVMAGPILYTMAWNDGNATLDSFDASNPNGTTTVIGPLGVSIDYGGLAYDTANNTMYMVDGFGNDSTTTHSSLYSVNLATGAATLIGSTGLVDVTGLTYDSTNNTLYAAQFGSNEPLEILNTTTGAATPVGSGISSDRVDNLAYDSANGVLYGFVDCLGCAELFTVDPTTGIGTLLSGSGLDANDSGIVFDPGTGLLWDLDVRGYLTTINPSSPYTQSSPTFVSATGESSGLALVPGSTSAVPEPSTFALFTAGAALVWARRRKNR